METLLPVQSCTRNGKIGFKSGPGGICYIGRGAKAKAERQLKAIKSLERFREDDLIDSIPQINQRRGRLNKKKINNGKKPAKWLPPIPIEKQYQRELRKFVQEMEDRVNRIILPNITSLVTERDNIVPENARNDQNNNDGYSDASERLIEALSFSFSRIEFDEKLASSLAFKWTNEWNNRQWKKVQRSVLGIDIFQREPWLQDTARSFISENVSLIKSMEADYLKSVDQIINAGLRGGDSSKTISKDIRKKGNVTKNKANLIARDQVSKLNGQLTKLRQTNIGIEQYTWRDSRDIRVRHNHRSKDGKVFSWSSPPSDTGHPGRDYQCFPGYSKVTSLKGVKRLFRRFYTGELTKIITSNGVLDSTPNHPILTDRGWVRSNEINIGDHLIEITRKGVNSRNLNINENSISFEKIFNLLSLTFPVENIPGNRGQFHNDGIDDKIDVIEMDLFLKEEVDFSGFKKILELNLSDSDLFKGIALRNLGSVDLLLRTLFNSPDRFIRQACNFLSFFTSQFAESYDICLASVSLLNSLLFKDSKDNGSTNFMLFGNRQYTHSNFKILNNIAVKRIYSIIRFFSNSVPHASDFFGDRTGMDSVNISNLNEAFPLMDVKFNKVLNKVNFNFSGHVYNSETDCNHYNIGNLTVHNCRCIAEAIFDPVIEELIK